ncbi:hypothetical protein AtDm6_2208 [Acetobacter tropicalis]|uniref:Uncharacterized protein n=1 Tax=Acetobacter tropicalis TaxID=104102 RepID=A0A094YMN5_9PROT|nr:hypothetical protein AtDm6_2208 [Acetobacter tropicalis]
MRITMITFFREKMYRLYPSVTPANYCMDWHQLFLWRD